MTERRTVFFVSDGTGITAQMLGHSLLTQFEGVDFNQVTLPFVDSAERAEECLARIEAESASGNGQPIVFSTLVNQDVRQVVRRAHKGRLDGLTIASERLHEIRQERRPGSRYADLDNCRYEVEEAENLMRREAIRSINSTSKSIEEIATTILRELRIQRQVY